MITVSRAINGIGINGNEYLLDEHGKVKQFKSRKEAERFLLDMGFTKKEIENQIWLEEETKEET